MKHRLLHLLPNKFQTMVSASLLSGLLGTLPLAAQTFNATRIDGRPATPAVSDPLIDVSTFAAANAVGNNSSDNIDGPCVIRIPDWIPAEERIHPSAVYYLYFAHHAGRDIRLAWSDSLTGTWTLFNRGTAPNRAWGASGNNTGTETPGNGVIDLNLGPSFPLIGRTLTGVPVPPGENADRNVIGIWGHIASPDVIVDNVNQRIVMYFHGNNNHRGVQTTFVATSNFGLNFNPVHLGGEAGQGMRDSIVAEFYLRTFQVSGRFFGYSNLAEFWRAPLTNDAGQLNTIANADSEGGLWNPNAAHSPPEALWWEQINVDDNPIESLYADNGQGINDPRHFGTYTRTHLDPSDTNVYVFYTAREDTPERIFLTVLDTNGGSTNPADWTAIGQRVILEPEENWEGADLPLAASENGSATGVRQLRDPYIFEDTMGTADLSDDRLYILYTGRGEEAIGIAELTFDATASNLTSPQGDLNLDSAPPESDTTLSVDFTTNANNSPGPTQPGYQAFQGGFNTFVTVERDFENAFGPDADATISLSGDRWRVRNPITGSFNNLLIDFGGPSINTTSVLELTLPAGTYDLTVYHHESSRGSAADADLTLTDADGARTPVNVLSGFGTAEPTEPTRFITTIRSDGSNDVLLSYNNQNNGNTFAFPINGLELTPISGYANWIGGFGLDPEDQDFTDDPDGDNLPNGLEALFGSNPGEPNSGAVIPSVAGNVISFSHPVNATLPNNISSSYEWSLNLDDWYAGNGIDGPVGGPTISLVPDTTGTTTTVTATPSETVDHIFFRVRASLTTP